MSEEHEELPPDVLTYLRIRAHEHVKSGRRVGDDEAFELLARFDPTWTREQALQQEIDILRAANQQLEHDLAAANNRTVKARADQERATKAEQARGQKINELTATIRRLKAHPVRLQDASPDDIRRVNDLINALGLECIAVQPKPAEVES